MPNAAARRRRIVDGRIGAAAVEEPVLFASAVDVIADDLACVVDAGCDSALGTERVIERRVDIAAQEEAVLAGAIDETADNLARVVDAQRLRVVASRIVEGTVVVYTDGTGTHGFLLVGNNYSTLDDSAGNNTQALGINNAGQIVGSFIDGTGQHGFLLSGDVYTTLDDPFGAEGTVATSINNAGQIVGYYIDSTGEQHGFLYSSGTYTTIDDPSATSGRVWHQ